MYLNRLGKHRNIPDVPFLGGCGRDKGYAYIVMPQMGRTIKEVFQESGPFSGDNIALLAMQMIEVLEHIHHKKHIYRDMKPSNVMFGTGASESSDSNIAYLVDYGTAETSLEFDGTVKSGDIAGTPKFMSVDVQTGGRELPQTQARAMAAHSHTQQQRLAFVTTSFRLCTCSLSWRRGLFHGVPHEATRRWLR